ncbi:reticulocalbin-2-like [Babylonia areolata]|uniref:reticulocalbin-2-like n=1 Tax=Babylonia areolata TaxID=304850 RepID=UPI003FD5B608
MIGCSRLCLVVVLLVSVWCEEHTRHGPRVFHSSDGEHNEDFDHQSILGSEDLDEEFEDMPEEEAAHRLEKMVQEHDLNKDGIITKEEMTKWVTSSFQKLDREEAMEKFDEEDDDKDGKVTWKEYLGKVYSFSSDDVQNMRITLEKSGDKTEEGREASSSLKMLDDDDRFFKAADLNGDGSLDRDEYVAFFFPPNYDHMSEVEMDRYMRDTDTDGDGKISMAEFMPEQSTDKESDISLRENFAEFDKDKDGFLSPEEAREWVMPKTDELVEDEVNHLISIADEDKDGQLSMGEILDKTKQFVGSSITDYGNLLQHDEL